MIDYMIRSIESSENHLLEDFLYESIFQREEENPLPRDVIHRPEVHVYIEGFGEPSDLCLVAETDGAVVGAVWTRILSGEVKGFGNIDDKTPEFAISLFKEYRNRGIGTALIREMLILLKSHGYKQASLAVQKDNVTAVRMYQRVGFEIVKELDDEQYLMLYTM